MAHDDDDLDFTALMRRQGVEPVKPAGRGRASRREGGPQPTKRGAVAPATTVSAPAKQRAPAGAPTAVARAGAPAAVARAGAPAAVARAGAPAAAAKPLGPVVAKQTVVDAELLAARAELAARQEALTRLTAERDGLAAQVELLLKERDAALRSRATAEGAAAALRAEAAALRPAPEVARISLAEALVARGVTDPAEQAQALVALAGSESAPRLISALETRDIAGLRSALERRLALLCGGPDCKPPPGAVEITVSPARCELCGGSEIQRAATRFIRACEAAGISRVRFVGGSPNYRTQLEQLFPRRGPLTVATTAGDKRVPLHKSKAQQRSDDLVVIWGATELDHATSGAYRAQFGRVETIAHRGIGRMLDLAAERITSG